MNTLTMTPTQIFLSYGNPDREMAFKIYDDLSRAGQAAWLDQAKIEGGQYWDRAIEDALIACDILLVLHSPSSFRSDNVRDEWSFVLNSKKRVIPLILENVRLPYRLERLQYIDFCLQPYDLSIKQLLALIARLTPEPTDPKGSGAKVSVKNTKQTKVEAVAKRASIIRDDAPNDPPTSSTGVDNWIGVRHEQDRELRTNILTIILVEDVAISMNNIGRLMPSLDTSVPPTPTDEEYPQIMRVTVSNQGDEYRTISYSNTGNVWEWGDNNIDKTLINGGSHDINNSVCVTQGELEVIIYLARNGHEFQDSENRKQVVSHTRNNRTSRATHSTAAPVTGNGNYRKPNPNHEKLYSVDSHKQVLIEQIEDIVEQEFSRSSPCLPLFDLARQKFTD